MQPGAGDHRARRAVGRQRADHRRERHRQGIVAQALHARVAARRAARWSPSTPAASRKASSRASCSATCKGAFTDAKSDRVGRFELADGGTLFLDEIANVPLASSRSCCACSRPASSSASDRRGRARRTCALISATNADLDAEVAAGRFRQDLLFRLNTIEIASAAAPRAARRHSALAAHFLSTHAQRYRKALTGFDAVGAAERSSIIRWPGNVRELDHAVERAVLMAQGDIVHAATSVCAPRSRWRAAPRRHEPRRRRGASDSQGDGALTAT